MAKFDLKFLDFTTSKSNISVEETDGFIRIFGVDSNGCELENDVDDIKVSFDIWLDKSTAIKFAKTLRTEINKITESEVDNEK